MGGLTPQQALALYSSANPFVTPQAYAHSNYSLYHDGALVRLLDWREPNAKAKVAHNALRAFITGDAFTCVGAKAAVQSGGYRFGYYRSMDDPAAADGLARDLCAFVAELPYIKGRYKTFVSVFGGEVRDELTFEAKLWSLLRRLHVLDAQYYGWDPSVSPDPASPSFAFSFAGTALFVVGLHRTSSRRARQFSHPALAFNVHGQFDELRRSGHFERVRGAVRSREIALQGSLNPNLADFGERSEARQYSGRAVEDDWQCPFHKR